MPGCNRIFQLYVDCVKSLCRLNKQVDCCIYIIYTRAMILSFRHRGLQRLFEKDDHSKVSTRDVQKIKHILAVLNRATKPGDMGLPGFYLHPLKGRLKNFWSITVRDNWRVVFKIKNGDAYDVNLIDYH